MERCLRNLTLEEGKYIYESRMVKDFLPCELKPWQRIETLVAQGEYDMVGMFEQEAMVAYGYFSKIEGGTYLLLDYFAVKEEQRGNGIGSLFLSEICTIYPKVKGVLVEVEDMHKAENLEEKRQRSNRVHFYEKAGLKLYPVFAKVYDAHYQLMFMKGCGQFPDTRELEKLYISLYEVLLGKEKMRKHMEIQIFG